MRRELEGRRNKRGMNMRKEGKGREMEDEEWYGGDENEEDEREYGTRRKRKGNKKK